MKCYHVTTEHGARYGVAASGIREARVFVAERLQREGSTDAPYGTTYVGSWDAPYGTVLCYTGPREP